MESYTVPVQIISKRSYVTTMSAIQGCTAVIDNYKGEILQELVMDA